jgi:large subunit ribosomal protein L9
MSASMEIILLERVENLGELGDTVRVKPGYARNYLLPSNKALRASKDNIAYFDSKKKEIEKQNEANRKEAEAQAKKMDDLSVTLVRLASESGQLYGSVTARDIADAVCSQTKETITRSQVKINQSYKTIGLFPVSVSLHPEVTIDITVNIARSEEEAKIQAKTGKALIAEEEATESSETKVETTKEAETKAEEAANEAKEEMLEESALEAEKVKAEEQAIKDAEKEAKAKAKAEAEEAKRLAKEAEEEALETTDEESEESQAPANEDNQETDEEKKEDS